MKVFATGHRGYIGAHLVDVLKQAGHTVIGCDIGLFEGCNWEPVVAPDREMIKDVRSVNARDLDGCDCVMHLAAISNDPMGEMDPQLTFDINRDASVRLAKVAKQAGVARFLFAGSCSVYGKGETLDLDEGATLNPLSAYARSKTETEQAVSGLADESFTPVYFATLLPTVTRRCSVLIWSSIICLVRRCLMARFAFNLTDRLGDRLFTAVILPVLLSHSPKRPKAIVHNKAVNVGGNSENTGSVTSAIRCND